MCTQASRERFGSAIQSFTALAALTAASQAQVSPRPVTPAAGRRIAVCDGPFAPELRIGSGIWLSVTCPDVDGDGDPDIVGGNWSASSSRSRAGTWTETDPDLAALVSSDIFAEFVILRTSCH